MFILNPSFDQNNNVVPYPGLLHLDDVLQSRERIVYDRLISLLTLLCSMYILKIVGRPSLVSKHDAYVATTVS